MSHTHLYTFKFEINKMMAAILLYLCICFTEPFMKRHSTIWPCGVVTIFFPLWPEVVRSFLDHIWSLRWGGRKRDVFRLPENIQDTKNIFQKIPVTTSDLDFEVSYSAIPFYIYFKQNFAVNLQCQKSKPPCRIFLPWLFQDADSHFRAHALLYGNTVCPQFHVICRRLVRQLLLWDGSLSGCSQLCLIAFHCLSDV